MNDCIKIIPIKSYDELVGIIQGRNDCCGDLRGKFIFRGLSDGAYELIPSALRKDNRLNDFVDEDFKLTVSLTHDLAVECGFAKENEYYYDEKDFSVNKYGNLIKEDVNDSAVSMGEFQIRKELNALMKFLSYADKVGLKVPVNREVRQLIEHNPQNLINRESFWPDDKFFELMALAQHYGVPTRFLDWSYDYRTALYFAVKNILDDNYLLNKKPENAILWALNFKYFDRDYLKQGETYISNYYRPEYNSNPNLNSQKGLFTFMLKKYDEKADEPYDKFIERFLNNYPQVSDEIPEDEPAFYKFIIPEDEKPNILKELYSEGYSEEYLFPGYAGVREAIENRVKLDELIKTKEELRHIVILGNYYEKLSHYLI